MPAESLAVGWKLYLVAAVTEVAGVPEIVTVEAEGVPPEPEVTWIENVRSSATDRPLFTMISMLLYAPTLPAVGVPDSFPVVPLKVAHEGFCTIENDSVRPPPPEVVGVKE